MSPATATQAVENLVLNVTQEIQVHAPLDTSFAALLEQLGPGADTPDGKAHSGRRPATHRHGLDAHSQRHSRGPKRVAEKVLQGSAVYSAPFARERSAQVLMRRSDV